MSSARTEENEKEKEEDVNELTYDPTSFEPRKPRSAKHIELLVKNVEFVREQVKSPPSNESLQHLPSAKSLVTMPKKPNKAFIPLILPETDFVDMPQSKTRYMVHMDIVNQSKSGKRPVNRVLSEFQKDDLTLPEIQLLASAVPTREVLEKAFNYCVKRQRETFRAACGIVSLAYDCAGMSPQQIRTMFIRLMQEFPVGHDSAHILATLQTAKKKQWVQLTSSMYSALINRLALSPDCNPETILGLVKEAEDSAHGLGIRTYNNLIRYFATLQNLEQCQKLAEVARKRYQNSEKLSTTSCLLTQAACIVQNPSLAWQYYLELKKKVPNCLVKFKNLFKHVLAVLLPDTENNLSQIASLFSDLTESKEPLDQKDLHNLLHRRPGFPYYCISILNYSFQNKIKPHPDFVNFVATEMYSKKHTDVIRYYLEFQYFHPSVKDMLGSILYYIPAAAEDTGMLENLLSGLHPVASQDATSSHRFVRDANVFAIAVDMYSKLSRHESVAHTYEFMAREGATPNFLVHALLFRLHFYTGLTKLRDHHYAHMKKCLAGRAFDADLTWLCTPLLTYYCEVITQARAAGTKQPPELAELRNIVPHAVAYLGVDKRSWTLTRAVAELIAVDPQLAVELLSAMKQYDPAQVTQEEFQPLIDATYPPQEDTSAKEATQEEDAGAKSATQEDASAQGAREEAAKGAKKAKKRSKGEVDVVKVMQEMGVKPSPAQAYQIVRGLYQHGHKLTQAAQVLADVIEATPNAEELRALITEFLVKCAEHNEGLSATNVLTHVEKQGVNLTQEQYARAVRSLLTHKLPIVALDVLRWMSTHARDAFESLRTELLEDAPDTTWAQTLQKMS
eukprot:Phypoly_transcript_02207.p1 GENE.Phypoly_transcript_02207~~Phypoly_transcript_02207.p1  ORF type:complete len:880 (+),score=193.92 Phypoly_transcript_02207:99-2642(+)